MRLATLLAWTVRLSRHGAASCSAGLDGPTSSTTPGRLAPHGPVDGGRSVPGDFSALRSSVGPPESSLCVCDLEGFGFVTASFCPPGNDKGLDDSMPVPSLPHSSPGPHQSSAAGHPCIGSDASFPSACPGLVYRPACARRFGPAQDVPPGSPYGTFLSHWSPLRLFGVASPLSNCQCASEAVESEAPSLPGGKPWVPWTPVLRTIRVEHRAGHTGASYPTVSPNGPTR